MGRLDFFEHDLQLIEAVSLAGLGHAALAVGEKTRGRKRYPFPAPSVERMGI